MSNANHFNRRDFIKLAGAAGALVISNSGFARATKPPIGRVVVIGGGYAGATYGFGVWVPLKCLWLSLTRNSFHAH
jgi:hypothetical protein